MQHDPLRRALADMAAVDAEKAQLAESVVDWLTAGEGIAAIDLAGVQRFAWYELPLKWMGPTDHQQQALDAGADLFDRLGLAGYAELLRSATTTDIHLAYARSRDDGLAAFREAYARSGIDPPDLGDFVWGDVMGIEEAIARNAVEYALEEAMTSGRMTLGARGWKSTALEVTAGVLDDPHPELPGQTRRTAILTERVEGWLRSAQHRSPQLYDLRSRHANRLLHPIPAPENVTEGIEPVTWFLQRVDQGVELTQAGYLPTAMVREGWDRFVWDRGWTDDPPQKEIDLIQIQELHLLLRRMGAVRKRHRALLVSKVGKRMRDNPEQAWRAVAAALSDGAWARAVAEVYTLLMLDGEKLDETLQTRAVVILGESGWQSGGTAPNPRTVMSTWYDTKRPLAALGGIANYGDWESRSTRLTPFGEATLLEQIRVDATGPRSDVR